VVEQARLVVEQVACTAVELVEAMVLATVAPAVALPVAVAMDAPVESLLERSAPRVASAAAAEDPVQVLCHTWEQAMESTYRRQLTSMWVLEVILTQFDQGEISLASSPVVVC